MAAFSFPDDPAFDSKTRTAVGVAYEMAIERLGLDERTGLATEFVTAMIMSVAYSGVNDPEVLCDHVVREMKGRSYLSGIAAGRPRKLGGEGPRTIEEDASTTVGDRSAA